MRPVHDSDVLLLLATTLASKRRPATLVDIAAAMDHLHDRRPPAAKLADSFARLAANGLLVEEDGGYRLTAAAEAMMATQPRRSEMKRLVFELRDKLAEYSPLQGAAVMVSAEALEAAMAEHRAAAKAPGVQLIRPVRSKETDNKRASTARRGPNKR